MTETTQKVSKILNQLKVWHKIQENYIITRRRRIQVPKINSEIAYLAGVIAGDGAITKTKRKMGGYYYRIQIVGRKNYIEKLIPLIKQLFNYKIKILRDKRKRNTYYINIQTAAIYAYFIMLGLKPGKKLHPNVPSIIAENPTLFKNYLKGLIDTDGHVKHTGRVQLKQRSKTYLQQIVHLLEKHMKIKASQPRVNYTEGKPYYYIRFKLPKDF